LRQMDDSIRLTDAGKNSAEIVPEIRRDSANASWQRFEITGERNHLIALSGELQSHCTAEKTASACHQNGASHAAAFRYGSRSRGTGPPDRTMS
jgi:hypothetical protein